MTKTLTGIILVSGALLVGGCASVPTGPSIMALPGTGKPFDQFRADDAECRRYAFREIGGPNAGKSTREKEIRNAAVGTAIGAVAGAAIGGKQGAGVGAGTGLIVGSMTGAEAGERSSYGDQRDYDQAYIQCMYGRGHRVPVSASMAKSLQQMSGGTYSPPPVSNDASIPPPPAGTPPPPPPGY